MRRSFIPNNRRPVTTNKGAFQPGLKRALLIGINYIDDDRYTLYGCINDTVNTEKMLRTLFPTCKDIRILSDADTDSANKPTRENILAGINWLTSGLRAGESVYLHYSGHGGLTLDTSRDEASGYDSCIYPISDKTIQTILDDELRALLVNKIPAGCKCFALFDCCHSGSALDLRYYYDAPEYGRLTMKQNMSYPSTAGSVVLLSGCSDKQESADSYDENNIPVGAMTNAFLKVLSTYGVSIKFKHLLWDIRQILNDNGYSQIPQLSCSANINMNDVFKL